MAAVAAAVTGPASLSVVLLLLLLLLLLLRPGARAKEFMTRDKSGKLKDTGVRFNDIAGMTCYGGL
jgi:hypothetical protein